MTSSSCGKKEVFPSWLAREFWLRSQDGCLARALKVLMQAHPSGSWSPIACYLFGLSSASEPSFSSPRHQLWLPTEQMLSSVLVNPDTTENERHRNFLTLLGTIINYKCIVVSYFQSLNKHQRSDRTKLDVTKWWQILLMHMPRNQTEYLILCSWGGLWFLLLAGEWVWTLQNDTCEHLE